MKILKPILAALFLSGATQAAEVIHRFHADITVKDDGALTVRETIEVQAEHSQIKRGIYRDFPTRYKDRWGHSVRVGFRVVGVERDGRPEPWHTAEHDNGTRIYAGDKNAYVAKGPHAYTFIYETTRQVGFFADHDELYWNVTGNGWDFPIEKAEAAVRLPAGVPVGAVRLEGYTGPAGAKGQDFQSRTDGGIFRFAATRALAANEGLTIVASWPKGFIRPPTREEKVRDFLAANRPVLLMLAGFLATLLYYLAVWFHVGKDPEAGVVVPLYEPPPGLSPAALRYITRMGFDNKTAAVALMEGAVKGVIGLKKEGNNFVIEKGAASADVLAPDTAAIVSHFRAAAPLTLTEARHSVVGPGLLLLKKALQTRYEKSYFVTNLRFFLAGLAVSALGPIAVAVAGSADTRILLPFITVWLSVWTVGVVVLVSRVVSLWRKASHEAIAIPGALFLTLFSLPFLAGELAGLFLLSRALTAAGSAVFLLTVVAHIFFYQWLKAPTLLGRRLLDHVEGFKMYLAAAEADDLRARGGPTQSPALYEQFLPHAMALDVEDAWTARFTAMLTAVGAAGATAPLWFQGRGSSPGHFASALGSSLSSAISSSSTAPGSSSGGGGGGSSGGGGGGGGGGGW